MDVGYLLSANQVYLLTNNAEEAELEQFYEDLQDLLELTLKRDVLLHYGGLECKSTGHEMPGITDKFGLGASLVAHRVKCLPTMWETWG